MDERNSRLVDFELVPIEGTRTYSGRWAQPDTAAAAAIMREVFDHPDEARERGRRGAAEIRESHSPEAAGRVAGERLDQLWPQAGRRAAVRESASQMQAARSAVLAGPVQRPQVGAVRRAARRTLLRVIKPYAVHQRRADLLTIDAIEELRAAVAELAADVEKLSERVDGAEPGPGDEGG
jgi:hypothetical protein